MSRVVSAGTVVLVALAACGPDGTAGVEGPGGRPEQVLPSPAILRVDLPLVAPRSGALGRSDDEGEQGEQDRDEPGEHDRGERSRPEGDEPDLRDLTIVEATSLNDLLARITEAASQFAAGAPLRDGDRAVWSATRPGGDETLAVAEWTDGRWSLVVAGRPPGGSWAVRMAATRTPGEEQCSCQGAAWIDLDAAGGGTGTVLALWSEAAGTLDLTAFLYGAAVTDEVARDDSFSFRRHADGRREFSFRTSVRIGDAGLADAVAVSRWTPGGAGRTDAVGSGKELDDDGFESGEVHECWSPGSSAATFHSAWAKEKKTHKKQPQGNRGEAATCAFAESVAPVLPSSPPEPSLPPLPPEAQ
jgi:hypothetical protein